LGVAFDLIGCVPETAQPYDPRHLRVENESKMASAITLDDWL